jgi:cyclic beta-1,2-glucan synthetase
LDVLQRYCRAYQRIQPLTIGELWAIAITLRVVLIENLRRLAVGIVSRLTLREKADALADQCLADADGAGSTAPRFSDSKPLAQAFAAQLFQRLRDHDPKSTPVLTWLHQALALQNTTADEVVHGELQRQGAMNVTVRNIITSLRLISSVDWAVFFESVSPVDGLLRSESAYSAIDFSTRDLYRHAIEELGRQSRYTEIEIARRALDAAQRATAAAAAAGRGASRECEAGYQGVFTETLEYGLHCVFAVLVKNTQSANPAPVFQLTTLAR